MILLVNCVLSASGTWHRAWQPGEPWIHGHCASSPFLSSPLLLLPPTSPGWISGFNPSLAPPSILWTHLDFHLKIAQFDFYVWICSARSHDFSAQHRFTWGIPLLRPASGTSEPAITLPLPLPLPLPRPGSEGQQFLKQLSPEKKNEGKKKSWTWVIRAGK